MKIISLHKGGITYVDDNLYDYFIQFVWSKQIRKDGTYYVKRYKRVDKKVEL